MRQKFSRNITPKKVDVLESEKNSGGKHYKIESGVCHKNYSVFVNGGINKCFAEKNIS